MIAIHHMRHIFTPVDQTNEKLFILINIMLIVTFLNLIQQNKVIAHK